MSEFESTAPGFRLSPQQEYIFGVGAEAPGFRSQCAIVIEDPDDESLRDALARVVSRHEILRTVFRRPPGMQLPAQTILDDIGVSWRAEAMSLNGSAQTAIEHLLADERTYEFDLENGPLVRAVLAVREDGSGVFVLTLPSVVADGASLPEIVREVLEACNPAEPLQYADYAEWRRETGTEADAPGREEPKAESPKLLFARGAAKELPFEVERLAVNIDAELARALHEAATRLGTDRTVLVEACWHVCVAQLSGEETVAIGSVMSGRAHDELVKAVGPFAQTLGVTTRFADETSLPEIVDQLKRSLREAERDGDAQSATMLAATAERCRISFHSLGASIDGDVLLLLTGPAARFELQLVWSETARAPSATLEYDPASFDESDIVQIATSLRALLRAAANDPTSLVRDLPLLGDDQAAELIRSASGPRSAVPNRCVHELFEEQVRQTPTRPAVRSEDRILTYAELDSRANAIACRLGELGVKPNDRIAMCMHRSIESLVAVLGILKAGGAYLPLNFEHPEARLRHQLAEAGSTIVLVQGDLEFTFEWFEGNVIDVELLGEADEAPTAAIQPNDLVYVLYTSGSTGNPKGVAVTHANLVNYSLAAKGWLEVSSDDGLQFAVVSAISTDLGNTAIFPALLTGGCVNLISPEVAMDAEAFAQAVTAGAIDILKITPSHLGALLAASESSEVLPRRSLVLGGEALSWDLVRQIRARAPSLRIINHYGPTETTVGSSTCEVPLDIPESWASTVPIGRPIANAFLYVVDRQSRLLPPGVAGELIIGGDGVANGYINRPTETASVFIRDPFRPGERAYRTGDRARYLPDGNIEFLGRVDDQVKIRGFRVEPGEIEAILRRHPSVRQAAVKAIDEGSGVVRLVGYVVSDHDVKPEELSSFLAGTVPEYMLPSAFVSLESLPLTASGKIDRQNLPDPTPDAAGHAVRYVAPRDEVEESISQIWSELLGVERVGAFDDFFELGGHSLLATQVIMRVRRLYGDVPLRAMFLAPTPAGLADAVRATRSS